MRKSPGKQKERQQHVKGTEKTRVQGSFLEDQHGSRKAPYVRTGNKGTRAGKMQKKYH